MSVIIDNTQLVINFNASGNEEIIQNVRTLFATPIGTVPFDREFGIDVSFLDLPIVQAKAKLAMEYVKKIRKYEPRAKIEKVTFTDDALNGSLTPKVVLGLNG
jgi:phage baseplate assembly protein W